METTRRITRPRPEATGTADEARLAAQRLVDARGRPDAAGHKPDDVLVHARAMADARAVRDRAGS